MKRSNNPYRKETRKKDAVERSAYRSGLTPVQQLERLDTRLGNSVGAKKERERLLKLQEELLLKQEQEKVSKKNKKNS